MAPDGRKAATAYLIDPLYAPQPCDETGPGSHFASTVCPARNATTAPALPNASTGGSSTTNNPFRSRVPDTRGVPEKRGVPDTRGVPDKRGVPEQNGRSSHSRQASGPSTGSRRTSPRQHVPKYRVEASAVEPPPRRSGSTSRRPPSYERATGSVPNSPRHRRRTSSLKERFPGDPSVEPLEAVRRDSLRAHRSPHLRKKHQPGPDTIDRLDPAIGGRAYHHEGPYDAALLSRNTSYRSSPVAALKDSNEEALKATPHENVKDSLDRHKPLDGVAIVPPGIPDRLGRTYHYEEGADLMHEDNNDGPGYKRWGGMASQSVRRVCCNTDDVFQEYSPDDLKGKGEPSFSLDKAYKAHTINDDAIELTNGHELYKKHARNATLDHRDSVDIAANESRCVSAELAHTNDTDSGVRRRGSIRDGLKKRIGSLRKKRADS